jgi:hypothetical protein
VIHYRKLLEAGHAEGRGGLPKGYRMRDILRMNLRHFLVRLDDPIDHVDLYDRATERFVRLGLPKVYHLNLVVRVRREREGEGAVSRDAHLRVVLNKDGIVRAEQLHAHGVTLAPRS